MIRSSYSLCLSVLFLVCLLHARSGAQEQAVLDRIVAVVGNEPILLSDVNAQVESYAYSNRIDANTPGLQQQILDAMINEKLILAKALQDTTIVITDDQVTAQLNAMIDQQVRRFGSEKKMEEAFGMPISRMKREFRDQSRKQLLEQAIQQNKFGDIQVSRREVEEFYDRFKDSLPKVPEELELYHIFKIPRVSETSKNAARAKLQRILDSIKAGGDFADFARRYSEDAATAASGGDLGFVRRGEFFKEFEEAVFSLRVDEVSGIVETPVGLHIIQLVERRGEQVHPRHILIKLQRDPSEVDSTITFLKGLRDSVLIGHANFSDLAKRYSDDKESAPLGGYLGQLPSSQFDKSVVDAVKGLKDNDISQPVEVPFEKNNGYQIILLKKRVPEHTMNLNDDYLRIERLATSYKQSTEYQKWITELRKEIYWESRL